MAKLRSCSRATKVDFDAVRRAFADMRDQNGRRLHWLGRAVSPSSAAEMIRSAIVHDYNEFNPSEVARELEKHKDVCVRVGREYSPVIYIYGPPATLNKISAAAKRRLRADEASRCSSIRVTKRGNGDHDVSCVGGAQPKIGPVLRLWWD